MNEENHVMLTNSQQPNTDSIHMSHGRNLSGKTNVCCL